MSIRSTILVARLRRPVPALALAASFALNVCVGAAGPVGNVAVPEPAKPVELTAYLGKWHEYARYEASFQKNCEGVTAQYSLRETSGESKIQVVNSCFKGALEGKLSEVQGRAKVVEGSLR